ncbi:MAG: D-alanyl-D-alanine carboxypeptidase/D-alanyl-D-alanine-endopeptidase [Kofleriaceae bacterium]|nr:D-alanyl-D-alanine carboxypeptidase/D-alanyl-D-alanine-endopeptidase [Kofleriaceae bacterium]
MKRAVLVVAMLALAVPVVGSAGPRATAKQRSTKQPTPASKKGAAARIAIGRAGELRPAREVIGRRDEPLTAEEETAKQIAKLLRGPLRNGVTGLFVADARTGTPLFAINADEVFNPASNVKMISTATALELLGPEFRYSTRLLGPAPDTGVVKGDVFLLGSYDPTLTTTDLNDIAREVAARGITSILGDIVVGSDPTRDGIYRAIIPIEITAGAPGGPPTARVPVGAEHVVVNMTAKTAKKPMRSSRLTFKSDVTRTPGGVPTITVTVGGTIGKGGSRNYPLWTRERTATAAYALRAALRAHGVDVTGELEVRELGDFVGDAVAAGALPIELGRHESARLADIVARINKWSINWLADRVITTAAALSHRAPPSMSLALEAMYGWLERQAHIAKKDLVIDTGSGLSYRTQITPAELVAIVRSAGGFAGNMADPSVAQAWLDSLSIAGTDGTLRNRVRNFTRRDGARARIRGKTGTLSTAIAMSGILEIEPDRPLAFALVTNTDAPLHKNRVRLAHDQLMGTLCAYLAKTSKSSLVAPTEHPPTLAPAETPPAEPTDVHDEAEAALDAEAANAP